MSLSAENGPHIAHFRSQRFDTSRNTFAGYFGYSLPLINRWIEEMVSYFDATCFPAMLQHELPHCDCQTLA